MTDPPSGWGPEGCAAAISVSLVGLAGDAELVAPSAAAPTVSPALTTVLRALADRDLSATFFVDGPVAAAEPLALTFIANAGHEVAALAPDAPALSPTLAALEAAGHRAHGARLPAAEELPAPTLDYLAWPGGRLARRGDTLTIPLDPALDDAAFVAPALIGVDRPARGPNALHLALQVAVGDALRRRTHLTLSFRPGLLERRDALAVFVETLELVEGLREAGRLWTPTLAQLAAWWPGAPDARG